MPAVSYTTPGDTITGRRPQIKRLDFPQALAKLLFDHLSPSSKNDEATATLLSQPGTLNHPHAASQAWGLSHRLPRRRTAFVNKQYNSFKRLL